MAEPTNSNSTEGMNPAEGGASVEQKNTPISDAAKEQQKKDDNWRVENPNKALIREPNPEMGGEGPYNWIK